MRSLRGDMAATLRREISAEFIVSSQEISSCTSTLCGHVFIYDSSKNVHFFKKYFYKKKVGL